MTSDENSQPRNLPVDIGCCRLAKNNKRLMYVLSVKWDNLTDDRYINRTYDEFNDFRIDMFAKMRAARARKREAKAQSGILANELFLKLASGEDPITAASLQRWPPPPPFTTNAAFLPILSQSLSKHTGKHSRQNQPADILGRRHTSSLEALPPFCSSQAISNPLQAYRSHCWDESGSFSDGTGRVSRQAGHVTGSQPLHTHVRSISSPCYADEHPNEGNASFDPTHSSPSSPANKTTVDAIADIHGGGSVDVGAFSRQGGALERRSQKSHGGQGRPQRMPRHWFKCVHEPDSMSGDGKAGVDEFFSSARFDSFISDMLAHLEVQLDRRLNGIESRIDTISDLSKKQLMQQNGRDGDPLPDLHDAKERKWWDTKSDEKKKKAISEFCQHVLKLPEDVLRSKTVYEFFSRDDSKTDEGALGQTIAIESKKKDDILPGLKDQEVNACNEYVNGAVRASSQPEVQRGQRAYEEIDIDTFPRIKYSDTKSSDDQTNDALESECRTLYAEVVRQPGSADDLEDARDCDSPPVEYTEVISINVKSRKDKCAVAKRPVTPPVLVEEYANALHLQPTVPNTAASDRDSDVDLYAEVVPSAPSLPVSYNIHFPSSSAQPTSQINPPSHARATQACTPATTTSSLINASQSSAYARSTSRSPSTTLAASTPSLSSPSNSPRLTVSLQPVTQTQSAPCQPAPRSLPVPQTTSTAGPPSLVKLHKVISPANDSTSHIPSLSSSDGLASPVRQPEVLLSSKGIVRSPGPKPHNRPPPAVPPKSPLTPIPPVPQISPPLLTIKKELPDMALMSDGASDGEIQLLSCADYTSDVDNILSFKKGDLATLVLQTDSKWWCVRCKDKCGWVSSDYWNILNSGGCGSLISRGDPNLWFSCRMTRTECEELLMKHGKQQHFFVRESTQLPGHYALSVKYNDRVHHFPIELTADNKYNIGKYNFSSIRKVIAYYKKNVLFQDQNGVGVMLSSPLVVSVEKRVIAPTSPRPSDAQCLIASKFNSDGHI